MQRQPLGDNTVHIAGPTIVANAGAIEFGGPDEGAVGVNSYGARGAVWDHDTDPGSPAVGGLQVQPIAYEPDYWATYDPVAADRWKGVLE